MKKEERNNFRDCYNFFENINDQRFVKRFGRGDGLKIYERRIQPYEYDFFQEESYVISLTDIYDFMKENGVNYDFKQYGEILGLLDRYLEKFGYED